MVNETPCHSAEETWRLFRIMAEFTEGVDTLSNVGSCVSIFGSARTKPTELHYRLAEEMGRVAAQNGFGVITGGGPGIMEAANKGAFEVPGSRSIGLNISLPFEQHPNPYQNITLAFRYFFVRKVMFLRWASGVVICPGGFGTLDEMFETLTLIQTQKTPTLPLVLMGKDFWGGMMEWIKDKMLNECGYIGAEDQDLLYLTDDPQEAMRIIQEFKNRRQSTTNF